VLEHTAFGRHVYASGYDTEVARLGGVNVGGVRAVTLLVSSGFAGLAGIMVTASLGAGDPTVGPSYLLPAFAAAFLGATQFRRGRFNPWGCVVAGLLLGTGDVGLLLIGSPEWGPSVFEGALLILAVSLTRTKIANPLRRLKESFAELRGTPRNPIDPRLET
jgi:ribose transport system permease protein